MSYQQQSYYTDMPDATTAQALKAIMEILEQQEENLKLVVKPETALVQSLRSLHKMNGGIQSSSDIPGWYQ
jgi:hypothetical protein